MNSNANNDNHHYRALLSFYGLLGLFAGVLAVLGVGIYQDWLVMGHRLISARLCLTFLRNHLWSLALLVLLVAMLAVILGRFGFSLWGHVASSRRLAARMAGVRAPLPADLSGLAARHGLVSRVVYTRDDAPYAFTFGLLRPRVVVSQGIRASLDRKEMEAVLLHEKYHLSHYDPLKVCLGRAMARSLFLIPLAGFLWRGYIQAKELAADRQAIGQMGDDLGLSCALWKLIPRTRELPVDVPLVGALGAVELRITQLVAGPGAARFPIAPGRQVAATLAVLLLALTFFTASCA